MSDDLLARIDLTDCPIGTVLDPNEPDQRLEERFFAGWTNGLTAPPNWRMPSFLRVVDDSATAGGAARVLEHINKTDRTLVTGHDLWGDLTIEASLRQLNAYSQPNSDDPHAHVGYPPSPGCWAPSWSPCRSSLSRHTSVSPRGSTR
jgi:hypothetical protein